MCGIYGITNRKVEKQRFLYELNRMTHRGPDGYGIWQNATGETTLGHRRLAVIDTNLRSNQPMCFDDRYVIVYNGEIYNYIELREMLQKEGELFKTESDTEVLLRLIIRKGPAALSQLNGMWSFVIYDKLESSLFLSRDRLGKKPLYYTTDGEVFGFSSEMKSLLWILNKVQYDTDFIQYSLCQNAQSESSPNTMFKGIKKFPAGSYGVYKNKELKINRFYFPETLLHQKKKHHSFEEATEEFLTLFQSSCKLRMRSDVPLGSALSGGIDSSFLVSLLSRFADLGTGKYKALIASFPGSKLDETSAALSVAKNAGVEAESVVIKPDIDSESLLEGIYLFEEIAGTAPTPFFQLYKAFRTQNVVVTLDGHGSDELFGGYSFDLYEKLKDDFPNIFRMRQTLNSIDKLYGFDNQISISQALPYFKGELFKKVKSSGKLPLFEKGQFYKTKLLQSTFYEILPTLLRNYDKYSMAAGVEIRMPFLDYRIMEFAFTLPNSYRFRNGFTKAIVRNAAKSFVPKAILTNKVKTGWNSPLKEWFYGPWKEWLKDEVASISFQNSELVDAKNVRTKVNDFFDTESNLGDAQNIWLLLQPYLIEKAFKKFYQ